MSERWWTAVTGVRLAQGDLLPDCHRPVFVDPTPTDDESPRDVEVKRQRLIVVTQSCDLENDKVEFVALCPIHTLDEFAASNPHFSNRKNWEQVRRGNRHSLHMLASHENPSDNEASMVVDFGHIVSLPARYLGEHTDALGDRLRLISPFLEHFSQAFARFFMRVGLPSTIPSFR